MIVNSGVDNGRYFINLIENRLQKLIDVIQELHVKGIYRTDDVCLGWENELWLNSIVENR